jgi:hypothetical protein
VQERGHAFEMPVLVRFHDQPVGHLATKTAMFGFCPIGGAFFHMKSYLGGVGWNFWVQIGCVRA